MRMRLSSVRVYKRLVMRVLVIMRVVIMRVMIMRVMIVRMVIVRAIRMSERGPQATDEEARPDYQNDAA